MIVGNTDFTIKHTILLFYSEDQSNDLFVTSSAYPNKGVFTMRHEFCLIMMRLIAKCKTFKRGPLIRAFPNLCHLLEELETILERMYQKPMDVEHKVNIY